MMTRKAAIAEKKPIVRRCLEYFTNSDEDGKVFASLSCNR